MFNELRSFMLNTGNKRKTIILVQCKVQEDLFVKTLFYWTITGRLQIHVRIAKLKQTNNV